MSTYQMHWQIVHDDLSEARDAHDQGDDIKAALKLDAAAHRAQSLAKMLRTAENYRRARHG